MFQSTGKQTDRRESPHVTAISVSDELGQTDQGKHATSKTGVPTHCSSGINFNPQRCFCSTGLGLGNSLESPVVF